MIRDPYSILGVSRSATDDEVKKAYRSLSRKYHPDANINNPNKEQAETMFKDVQQAYQQIMDERTKGYSSHDRSYGSNQGGFDYGDFWGFGGFSQNQNRRQNEYEDDDTRYMKAVKNYINSRSFREAYNLLQSISRRDSEWYYLSAIANAGIGNNVIAKEHAQMACSMEPDNMTYQSLLRQFEGGGNWYSGQTRMYGNPDISNSRCCTRIIIGYLVCTLCTGGSGLCCGSGVGRNSYNGYNSYYGTDNNSNTDNSGNEGSSSSIDS